MSNLENLCSLTQSEHFWADQAKFFNFVIHILYVAYNAPDKIVGILWLEVKILDFVQSESSVLINEWDLYQEKDLKYRY